MHTAGSFPQQPSGIEELPEATDPVRLLQAIDQLPRELRQTVVLHDVVRLPHEEIAEWLGCPAGLVRILINQARLQLYRSLQTESLTGSAGTAPVAAAEPVRP